MGNGLNLELKKFAGRNREICGISHFTQPKYRRQPSAVLYADNFYVVGPSERLFFAASLLVRFFM